MFIAGHAVPRQVIRLTCRNCNCHKRRIIQATSLRPYSQTPRFRAQIPPSEDPANTTTNHDAQDQSEGPAVRSEREDVESLQEQDTQEETQSAPSLRDVLQPSKDRVQHYGSAARRSVRNRKVKEVPHLELPAWFLADSVHIPAQSARSTPPTRRHEQSHSGKASQTNPTPAEGWAEETEPAIQEKPNARSDTADAQGDRPYQFNPAVYEEVYLTIRSQLALPTNQHFDTYPAAKTHVLLQCPVNGGTYFLDSLLKKVSDHIGADLVRIDIQDFAEIGGDFLEDDGGGNLSKHSLRSLMYRAQESVAAPATGHEETAAEDEEDEGSLAEGTEGAVQQRGEGIGIPGISGIPVAHIVHIGRSHVRDLRSRLFGDQGSAPDAEDGQAGFGARPGFAAETRQDDKRDALLESFIDAALTKRKSTLGREEDINGVSSPPPTIIQIRDWKELQETNHGSRLLLRLLDLIARRRLNGQMIICVGTVSSAALMPILSNTAIKDVQSENPYGPGRTIIIPPIGQDVGASLQEDQKARIGEINLRHLRDMIRLRTSDLSVSTRLAIPDQEWKIDSSVGFTAGLRETVWSIDKVHRIAIAALGSLEAGEELSIRHVESAISALDDSDSAKFSWLKERKHAARPSVDTADPTEIKKQADKRMARLRRQCDSYEKKLLNGVIDAESINTTFDDVRAPVSTIEALKNLTSLSLIRPEAFSYGVLATDKIPGLLLYGPPGTGKTLLAKAVAKESGATVLEVSGSDLYDMYVGEGEKNTRAVFTLARKLAPCVVFIDEADAIFGSRGGGASANRTTHRELINQFLREWDGMNSLSAFIMVATNRPFDLDDAVLRRLPRRLLVDLPTEKDREKILGIHLKHEQLGADVSLPKLASRTPLYSGSDLKNVAVAAALACVREENDAKAASGLGDAYEFAEKRTLGARHFDRAIDQIGASVSEDMSSLAAIRKFDERFGDRAGRKKRGGFGFGDVKGRREEEKEGAGRVRKAR